MSPTGDTILVVDDDPDIREALEDVLRSEGYIVVTAPDGQVALDMLGMGLRPYTILLDLMMPRLNGFEFLQHLRAGGLGDLRVVVVSANTTYLAEDLGVSHILRKPVTVESVVDAIERRAA